MAAKALPTTEYLRQLLRYESDTGKLFWRERSPEMFSNGRVNSASKTCRRWNKCHAGSEAFTFCDPKGYFCGTIDSKKYRAHRIIWKIWHGYDPDQIDHINGNPSDNRIENLRNVNAILNARNARMIRGNSSGVNGVVLRGNRWKASARLDGKHIHLGSFATIQEAAAARKAAEKIIGGYTLRHGLARETT